MLVMLKKSWPGNFRRTIRDSKGKERRVIEFHPGDPVDVSRQEYEFLVANGDLDSALQEVSLDGKGRARPVAEQVPEEASEPVPES